MDEHAALESRLLEQQANGTTPADALASIQAKMDAASPAAVGEKWNGMEAAEREFEALLLLKLAAAEKAKTVGDTDDMAGPLMAKTDSLLKWIVCSAQARTLASL